jgi:aldehyde:ferredoxin oxidoreductase
MESYVTIGNTPIHNFRDGEFPGIDKISAVAVKNTVRTGMEGCYGCVVRCKKIVKIDDASYQVDPVYGGPEYETLAALGNNCGVSDLKAICKGNELCNAYSLDTISAGLAISFAMECYENGLLTNQDTGGINLRFGNAQAMLQVIELIAYREGIGNILADGVKMAAEKIGPGAEKFTMQVKGLEFGMHDPRCKAALGLAYATNPHGADHCLAFQDTNFTKEGRALDNLHPFGILEPLVADDLSPKKVDMFHYVHSSRILMDSLTVCSRPPFNLEQYTEILKSITGWDTGTVELLRTADRILTLARLFNIREGFSVNDDQLPERMFEGRVGGPATAKRQDREKLERAKSYYYSIMGWDTKTGIPKPETLMAQDIAWAKPE